jgi:hypothetical protein
MMSDAYQPIYDAVRSKIHNGDVGFAIQQAVRDANLSHYAEMAYRSVHESFSQYERPSVMFRPTLSADGTKWCALYGEDLQSGVAGFGDTPDKAMQDFDRAWWNEATPEATRLARKIAEEEAEEERRNNGQFGVGA